jgi:hypothetical protein
MGTRSRAHPYCISDLFPHHDRRSSKKAPCSVSCPSSTGMLNWREATLRANEKQLIIRA